MRYLGVHLSDDLSDDCDIVRQRSSILARGNTLGRKFAHCSTGVKKQLFQSFVTPMYGCALWSRYRTESWRRVRVAYNDAFRVLFRYPRNVHVTPHFVASAVPTFREVVRNALSRFLLRVLGSRNVLISAIAVSACVKLHDRCLVL